MATIGTFTKTDAGFTGSVKTLTLNVKARFVANDGTSDKAPDCLASAVVGLRDMFWLAEQAIDPNTADAALKVRILSLDGKPVTDGHGRVLAVDGACSDAGVCDAILVPGFIPEGRHGPPPAVLLAAAAGWLRDQHAHGALICGSCSGVFPLNARLNS